MKNFVKNYTLKGINEAARTIDVVISSNSIDRDGDIVEQSGIYISEEYKSIPVFVDHDHRIEKTIGHIEKNTIQKSDAGTTAVITFVKDIPLAETVWKLIKSGAINDVSIGFIPKKYEMRMINGQNVRVFTSVELFEVSVVGVASNRDAKLRKAMQDGVITNEELKELGVVEENPQDILLETLQRLVEIHEKNHQIIKKYRKTLEKMRKRMKVDPLDDEEATIDQTFSVFCDLVPDDEEVIPLSEDRERDTPLMRTITDKEIKKMLEKI